MNAGDFNKKIKVQQRKIVTDSLGQEIDGFENYATVWAMVRTIKSSEAIIASNLSALKETRFVIRYSKKMAELIDLDKTHFVVVLRGQAYDVKSVINDDEADKTITIVAERIE